MTIDERISAELLRSVPEVDEHAAWDRIRSQVPVHRRFRAFSLVAVPVAAAGLVLVVSILLSSRPTGPEPASDPESPFLGTWVTADLDGSTPTMILEASTDGVVEIVVVDDYAAVCSGAPSTMIGTGRFEGDSVVVIPAPVLTCDDGSQPEALSGPPLEEQLPNLTFTYDPESDILTDNFGLVWDREGSERPSPDPTATGWWPQSSAEEVAEAQERADAGDPDYTWQLDPELDGDAAPWGAEIFARFIEEELGWEEFIGGWDGSGYLSMGAGGGVYQGVAFIRCAPGETNPLSHLYADAPPEIRACAPTIDELRYETVSVDVSQPGRRGPEGIWVVDRWEMRQSKSSDPGSLFEILYREFDGQVEQVVPPSDAEVTALLQAFLRARVDGESAEQYLLREPKESAFEDVPVPLLYATTGGAAYERFEIERVQGPVWPSGWTESKVRLFAEGGTVVEQSFVVVRLENGPLGLTYGYPFTDQLPTTENGQTVPLPYSILDGEVTFAAAPPWRYWDQGPTSMSLAGGRNENVVIAADPLSTGAGCEKGPAAADAEALARRIMADPDFETIGTTPVRIAGIDGLQMDVAVVTDDWGVCFWSQLALELQLPPDALRMRLYLINYPGDAAQVLTIAVIAPEEAFEHVLAEATSIVESITIHTG